MRAWYEEKLGLMFSGIAPLVFAGILAIAVEITAGHLVDVFNSFNETVLVFRKAYRVLGFFLLGLCLWSAFRFMLLPGQILRLKLKTRLPNLAGVGIQAIGQVFFRVATVAAVSFVILGITVFVSPLSSNLAVMVWLCFGAVCIVGLFLTPLAGIHQVMAREKRAQLITLSGHIERALSVSMENPTPNNLQALKEILELQRHIQDMNDWPFNTKMVWRLISVLLIPLLLVVLQIAFKVN